MSPQPAVRLPHGSNGWRRFGSVALGAGLAVVTLGATMFAGIAALNDLATQAGSGIAVTTAKFIEYRAVPVAAKDGGPQLRTEVFVVLASLLAIAVGMAPTLGRRRRTGARNM